MWVLCPSFFLFLGQVGGGGGGGGSNIPRWLRILLGEKFFDPCGVHDCVKKNEKNTFCLDCCVSICPHCLPPHRHHHLLQIRRYVYHDVIRLDDAQKLLNCSLVQPYTTNSAKVVFLNQRPMSRPFRGLGNFCVTCDRSLQEGFLFCSLSCKVHHRMTKKIGLEKRLQNHSCEPLPSLNKPSNEGFPELEDGHVTLDSVLDLPVSPPASPDSTPSAEFVRRKRSRPVPMTRVTGRLRCLPATDVAGFVNRRKGIPHRSPLH
ncbi:protein RGF1 INDUCIBLE TRANSCRIPTION FACTOR 1-like [Syzygium oleosum]|uniref:protein RGF1 INDUCIBLE TRANSCRIPTION FACTOR 1-like n=1 Tax=Syzygium oleosum TaxID=219896 RepID=UPI0024BBB7FA|nr:protein RGF1 INDUCIBLE TRANSCRIPTION FACTOR 1-like [Syzygium oleosum]